MNLIFKKLFEKSNLIKFLCNFSYKKKSVDLFEKKYQTKENYTKIIERSIYI